MNDFHYYFDIRYFSISSVSVVLTVAIVRYSWVKRQQQHVYLFSSIVINS